MHNPPHKLPTSVQFIEQLISQLSDHTNTPDSEQNNHAHPPPRTQSHASPSGLPSSHLAKVKPLMLTLHCIFPNELLLALDILDRRLMRRLTREDKHTNSRKSPEEDPLTTPGDEVFYVISTSSDHPHPQSQSLDQKGYEVRLQAWNCTCSAFTIAAFRDPAPELLSDDEHDLMVCDSADYPSGSASRPPYVFGGSLVRGPTRSSPPVCKHLLACLLGVRCPGLLGPAGEDGNRVPVRVEELAGLCAGWGG